MSEVNIPSIESTIPRMAVLRCSDFIPKYPKLIPISPMMLPQIGIKAAMILMTPRAAEIKAKNLFVRSSGSKLL